MKLKMGRFFLRKGSWRQPRREVVREHGCLAGNLREATSVVCSVCLFRYPPSPRMTSTGCRKVLTQGKEAPAGMAVPPAGAEGALGGMCARRRALWLLALCSSVPAWRRIHSCRHRKRAPREAGTTASKGPQSYRTRSPQRVTGPRWPTGRFI